MGVFRTNYKIDGVPASLITKEGGNLSTSGNYEIKFPRELGATIEDIDKINWENPTVVVLSSGYERVLPAGCSFEVVKIDYAQSDQSYTVTVKLSAVNYGDVSAYKTAIESYQQEVTQLTAENGEAVADLEQAYELLYGPINASNEGSAEA